MSDQTGCQGGGCLRQSSQLICYAVWWTEGGFIHWQFTNGWYTSFPHKNWSHLCKRSLIQTADNRTCLVNISCSQFGDHCFATAGPTMWNSLPEQLRQADITFGQFKRSLKTLRLVSWAAAPCVWMLRALTWNLTYLLTIRQIFMSVWNSPKRNCTKDVSTVVTGYYVFFQRGERRWALPMWTIRFSWRLVTLHSSEHIQTHTILQHSHIHIMIIVEYIYTRALYVQLIKNEPTFAHSHKKTVVPGTASSQKYATALE